jgi:hypothetical protein
MGLLFSVFTLNNSNLQVVNEIENKKLLNLVSNNRDNLDLIKPLFLDLCKQYLKGVWENIGLNDFVIYKPW